MDIKVGEYVRTYDGEIFRVTGKQRYKDLIIYTTNTFCKYTEIVMNEIVKIHSKKQKDLICEGDIILWSYQNCIPNISEVMLWHRTTVPYRLPVKQEIKDVLGIAWSNGPGVMLEEITILKILTKEQFLQNCYEMEV